MPLEMKPAACLGLIGFIALHGDGYARTALTDFDLNLTEGTVRLKFILGNVTNFDVLKHCYPSST